MLFVETAISGTLCLLTPLFSAGKGINLKKRGERALEIFDLKQGGQSAHLLVKWKCYYRATVMR